MPVSISLSGGGHAATGELRDYDYDYDYGSAHAEALGADDRIAATSGRRIAINRPLLPTVARREQNGCSAPAWRSPGGGASAEQHGSADGGC